MKDRKFGLGVLICIFNKDFSKILLVKRNQEKRNKNKDWGFVGGRVELGEKLVDACIRESREEIGIRFSPENLKLIEIKETPYLTQMFHAIHFIYATVLDENEKITLNEESDEYKWFKLKKLPQQTIDSKEHIIELSNIARKKLCKYNRWLHFYIQSFY
jgi:ADP-ribose pyrophosphatase YjhB (NUDIX family)